MSSRSDELWWKINESAEKFDYFICGVTGALFGYLAQTYTPHKIDGVIPALMPIALLLLATSFALGTIHLKHVQYVRRLNHDMLHWAETAGKITEALSAGGTSYFNQQTGEMLNAQQMASQREGLMKKSAEANSIMTNQRSKTQRLANARNGLLIIGFLVIVAAKVLQPYLKP